MKFVEVKVGEKFIYDSEKFVKVAGESDEGTHGLAWSIDNNGRRKKQWAFELNEVVQAFR